MNNTISIRFLKQGNISVQKPDGFDKWGKHKRLEWSKHTLNSKINKERLDAISDYTTMDITFFDETLED